MTIDHVALADFGDAALERRGFTSPSPARDITVDDFAPYVERFRAWHGGQDFRQATGRTGTSANTVESTVHSPRLAPRTIPLFFSWLRRTGQEPFVPTPEEPTMTLPLTSPRAAFATLDAALVAYHAWVASDDPALPDLMTTDQRTMSFRRSLRDNGARRGRDYFDSEIGEGWSNDTFTRNLTQYAQGFWRDVRDLGWGTPAFRSGAAQPQPVAATVAQIRDYRNLTPELIEPWRKTFIRFVTEEKVASNATGMSEDWLTSDLSAQEAYDDSESTLTRMMEMPHTMPGTSGYFARWLERNGQTTPDPTGPAVPSGDGVIPIGPEHPGWAEFWERARQAAGGAGGRYETYWQTLAREFGVLPPREHRVVHVLVPVTLEVEADETDATTLARATRQVSRGYGLNPVATGHVIVSRTPITADGF